MLGFDRNGRLLELTILTFDSGQLVIHAMKARRKYVHLLDWPDTHHGRTPDLSAACASIDP